MTARLQALAAVTESELLDRARSGDRAALAELLERHAPNVYRFGMRMCRQPEDAAEVAQETLLLAMRKLHGFRGDASLASWLFTLVRSICRRMRRRRSGEPAEWQTVGEDLASEDTGPEEAAERARMREHVEAALASLSPEHREAVLLRDVEGLPVEELAGVLGLSIPAAKSRLHRARAALASAVQRRVPETAAGACRDLPRLFSRWLEGEIRPETCARMESHLAGCSRCSAACAGLKAVLGICRTLPPEPVPGHIARALREAVLRVRPAERKTRESARRSRASHRHDGTRDPQGKRRRSTGTRARSSRRR